MAWMCWRRAFVKAAPKLPGASLILLGAGSQGETIRSILATRRSDAAGSSSVGAIPQAEIHRWYRKADLYVSPSHVDGSSVSLMEAMASGTPPLVSDIPANREWVREDANGWLFRDGDARSPGRTYRLDRGQDGRSRENRSGCPEDG